MNQSEEKFPRTSGNDDSVKDIIERLKSQVGYLEQALHDKSGGKETELESLLRDISGRLAELSEEPSQQSDDSAPIGLATLTSRGRVSRANRRLCELLGVNLDSMIGSLFSQFVSSDCQEAFAAWRHEVMLSDTRTECVLKLSGPAAGPTWVRLRGAVVSGDDSISSLNISVDDVTVQKQTELHLRDSDAKWWSLAEHSNEFVIIVDRNGMVEYINRVFPDDTVESVIGSPIYDYLEAEAQESNAELLERVFESGTPETYESSARISGVDDVWFEVDAVPLYSGRRIVSVMLIARDISYRKQAEADLAASEKKYRDLLQNIPVGIFRTTVDGRIVSASPGFCQMFGYESEEDLAELHAQDIYCDPNRREELGRELLEKGFVSDVESRMRRKDGTTFWTTGSARAITDDNGEMVCRDGMLLDITERKKVEEELRESESKFAKAFEASSALVAISGVEDGRFIDVNEAFIQAIGYSREETIGKTSQELNMWSDWGMRQALVEKLKQNGSLRNEEVSFHTKEGDLVHGLFSADIIYLQDKPVLLTTAVDITERKKAQEALAASERKYRSLLTNVPVGVYRTTPEGDLLSANPALANMIGCESVQELMSENVESYYHNTNDRQNLLKRLEHEKSVTDFEMQLKHKNGSLIWVSAHVHAEFDDNGKMLYLDGILEDITHRKIAIEQEKARYQENFEQAKRIAGVFAHEVRNGLFPATAALRLLKIEASRETVNWDTIREYARTAERAVTGAAGTTKLITSFTRLNTEVMPERVSLQEVLDEVVENNSARLQVEDIKVSRNGPFDVFVRANRSQLAYALNNIVVNSIQALAGRPESSITIEWELKDQQACIYMEDNGCGIPTENLRRIFDPFFSTKTSEGGSGIGLATTRRLIEMYEGSVSVASKIDEYTRFEVLLTLYPESTA